MKSFECPEIYNGKGKSLFLAGGISNCPNWQSELVKLIEGTDLVIFNPRRKDFTIDNPKIEEEQIFWEYNYLKKASVVSFWFPKETVCPITLYELGKQSALGKSLFIGIHPEYSRRRDMEIQMKLARPEIKIVYSLEELAMQIKEWKSQVLNNKKGGKEYE